MWQDLQPQIVGVLFGLVSSWIFWRVLVFVRPDVRLPDRLAYDAGTGKIRIKIANFSRYQATDIEVRLFSARRSPERLIHHTAGEVKSSTLLALDPKQTLNEPWRIGATYIFVCGNGQKLLEDIKYPSRPGEHRIVITLTARHAISGTARVIRRTYVADDVVEGRYVTGLRFTIDQTERRTREDLIEISPEDLTEISPSGSDA